MNTFKQILLLVFFCTIVSAKAYPQVFIELSGTTALPVNRNHNTIYEPGAGARLHGGYSIDGRLDVGASLEFLWLNSMLPEHTKSKVTASCRYHILDKNIRPYLGFDIGYLRSSITPPFGIQTHSYGMSAGPLAGCLVSINFLDGLYLSTEASYNEVFSTPRFRLFAFRLGLAYYI